MLSHRLISLTESLGAPQRLALLAALSVAAKSVAASAIAALAIGSPVVAAEPQSDRPLVYAGTSGLGVGKRIVFLAGDHEYRSEETLPALARILAARHGFHCTVLFTVHPETGEIDPAADHLPGTEALADADLAVVFLRFKNLPASQMQPIVDYLDRAGPVVGLRTATHAFKIPKQSPFARYDFQHSGADYPRGFGRQVLGESWSGHYGKNHEMSTRLDPVAAQREHPVLRGVQRPWVQSGGYWTEPEADSTVLALAQPLQRMTPDAPPAADKAPCPGVWIREYRSRDGQRTGRVCTTTYGASEDILDADFRRLLVNGCCWACGLEERITPELNIEFVGPYHPTTFRFHGHRRGVRPIDLEDLESPILSPDKPTEAPPR